MEQQLSEYALQSAEQDQVQQEMKQQNQEFQNQIQVLKEQLESAQVREKELAKVQAAQGDQGQKDKQDLMDKVMVLTKHKAELADQQDNWRNKLAKDRLHFENEILRRDNQIQLLEKSLVHQIDIGQATNTRLY